MAARSSKKTQANLILPPPDDMKLRGWDSLRSKRPINTPVLHEHRG
jgi:hypothetical protein